MVADVFTTVSAGNLVALTVTDDVGEVTAPELADAMLMTLPASMSACVVV